MIILIKITRLTIFNCFSLIFIFGSSLVGFDNETTNTYVVSNNAHVIKYNMYAFVTIVFNKPLFGVYIIVK